MSLVGSNSAVSRFLRHGYFTPETGHWLARLAGPKSFVNYESSCAKFASEVAALRETLAVERGRTAVDPPALPRRVN
jgi:hypothetical protein